MDTTSSPTLETISPDNSLQIDQEQDEYAGYWQRFVIASHRCGTDGSHPLFRFDLARIGWKIGKSPVDLRQFVQVRSILIPIVIGVLIGLMEIASQRNRASGLWLLLALGLNAVFSLLMDAYSMHSSLSGINEDRQVGHWDVIRITLLHEAEVIHAKFAVAQIRAWRWLVYEIGLRHVVVAGLITLFMSSISNVFDYSDSLEIFFMVLVIGMVCLIFIQEAKWRSRAMIAVGVGISARGMNTTNSALSAVGMVIGLRIMETVIAAVLFWLLVYIPFRISYAWAEYYDPVTNRSSEHLIFFVVIIVLIGSGVILWGYWRIVRGLALSLATRWAYR
jgi:hypothetical protein